MNCPQCPDKSLEQRRVPYKDRSKPGSDATAEMALDLCAACGGIWFDKDELDRYLDAKSACVSAPAGAKPAAPAGTLKCPRCALDMAKGPAPGNPKVVVDSCPKCAGLWLEAGEAEAAADTSGVAFQDRLKAFFGGPGGS